MISNKYDHLTRQMDLIPFDVLDTPITIIGAGAVGGWTTLGLAKMGFNNITVIDFDDIAIENMNSQLYGPNDIGNPKVRALEAFTYVLSGTKITGIRDHYGEQQTVYPGVVISAVDSMQVRRAIWDEHQGRALNTKAIIDPRMGAETALLYVMDPMSVKDDESYRKTLYTDDDAVQEPCTRKSTAYCAMALSGLICSQVKNLLVSGEYSRITQWSMADGGFMQWRNK